MFGRSGDRTDQSAVIGELSAIRDGVNSVRTDLAVLGQEIKGIRTDQGRHEERLNRLDQEVQPIRALPAKVDHIDRQLTDLTKKVGDISDWRTVQSARWSGPQRAVAVVASILPISVVLWGIVQWLVRVSSAVN